MFNFFLDASDGDEVPNRVGTFRNFFRMTRGEFDYVLGAIQSDIVKMVTNQTPICPEERLMVSVCGQ
jgi:hypothetical protein